MGGTSGIGKALALGLAGAGADVVESSRSAEAPAAVTDAIRALGRKTLLKTFDVTSRASIEALRTAVLTEFAAGDTLINGAGMTQRIPTLDCAEELVSTALYPASDATSFTTGQILAVDGGFLASAVNQMSVEAALDRPLPR